MKKRIVIALAALFVAVALFARVGGGESYSGGGDSGGGGSDGGGEVIGLVVRLLWWLTIEHPAIGIPVDIIVIVVVIKYKKSKKPERVATITTRVAAQPKLDGLRRFDPNFSEIVFSDFCYSLYARVHQARGENDLARYAPFLNDASRKTLLARNPRGLREVSGVVIGAFRIVNVRGLDTANVYVTVMFESNYTEVGEAEQSWYVREHWVLERKRDILSPPPEKAKADHCPRCGGPLKTRTDGSCEYCGVKIENGSFQWYVQMIAGITVEQRGPLLASNVPEQGTDRATISQPNLDVAALQSLDPRVREIAQTLQDAWNARDWERVRPLETESLFQMHRYWIDAYVRQGKRNIVDDYKIARVLPVKFTTDAFYESVTVRLWASGRDSTIDDAGKIVAGSKTELRVWSEYWTLIRSRGAAAGTKTMSCPNCGATVTVGATGICEFCAGKLTTSEFDWVLSRIEQDEAYAG